MLALLIGSTGVSHADQLSKLEIIHKKKLQINHLIVAITEINKSKSLKVAKELKEMQVKTEDIFDNLNSYS